MRRGASLNFWAVSSDCTAISFTIGSFHHTGFPSYEICKWLGHADFKATQIYAHFAPIYDGDIEKISIQAGKEVLNL